MLYDERWDKETKSKPETKTARPTRWQRILLSAADELETNGWCQGDFAQGTRHCALGAIRKVGRNSALARYAAEAELQEALEYMPIVSWNDHPARTKEEVVAKLREVANSYRFNLRLEGPTHAV